MNRLQDSLFIFLIVIIIPLALLMLMLLLIKFLVTFPIVFGAILLIITGAVYLRSAIGLAEVLKERWIRKRKY